LRAGINLSNFLLVTGKSPAGDPEGVAPDLAREIAKRLDVPAGGRIEPQDESPTAAALREAREEIGLEAGSVSVVGFLTDHVVISGFRVTPVVAMVRPGFELLVDAQEVEDTFEVPLTFVLDPRNHQPRLYRFRGTDTEAKLFDIPYGERKIWGATAGMLVNLYRVCTEGTP
jgi:8-oxo-dGTP pyrophosphatase MutT (NUDIX family)